MFKPRSPAQLIWKLAIACALSGTSTMAFSQTNKQTQTEPDLAKLLQPVPPLTPEKAIESFKVEDGFKVELVAAEPDVVDPIAMAFDAAGRLYVCEDIDYPFKAKEGEKPLGRIRLLEDRDSDGRYETSHIFAEHVHWPSGVVCWKDGVFVSAPPQILYLKDTDGDHRADVRRVVYDGFGTNTAEDILNNLKWGIDNLIYGAASYNGGHVRSVESKKEAVSVRGRSFRFDPNTLAFESIPETGDFGNCFDDWGNRFVSNAGALLIHPVIGGTYLDRNPFMPPTRVAHRSSGNKRTLVQISPPERWRVIRKQYWDRWVNKTHDMRASRFSAAELAEQGQVTGGAGCGIYRGNALPPTYLGNSFTAEPAGNVVIRLKVQPRGVTFDARPVKSKREFLASKDNWFRPVNVANGPDGCLYVLDMSREIIEDPSAIPTDILKHIDVTAGRDRGRIYRIIPDGFERPGLPALNNATAQELSKTLKHANAWHRQTAQRLLVESNDKQCVADLKNLVRGDDDPRTRIHALWTLAGIAALGDKTLLAALDDNHPSVREHAIRLAESRLNSNPTITTHVLKRTGDPSIRVRMQTALSLGYLKDNPKLGNRLANLFEKDGSDPWIRIAIMSSLKDSASTLFKSLLKRKALLDRKDFQTFTGQLAVMIGRQNKKPDVLICLESTSDEGVNPGLRIALVARLAEGLRQNKTSLADIEREINNSDLSTSLKVIRESAQQIALDAKEQLDRRLLGVTIAADSSFRSFAKTASALLSPQQPQQLQIALLQSLASSDDPNVAGLVLEAWPSLSPAVRLEAMEFMFRTNQRTESLLQAIQKDKVKANDIPGTRIEALRKHRDTKIRQQASKLFASTVPADQTELLNKYRSSLRLKGDFDRGRTIFKARCAICHRLHNEGVSVGANLQEARKQSAEQLLTHIIDPNRKVDPRFVNYMATTTDGDRITGIIAAESPTSMKLLRPNGVADTVSRTDIESLRSTGLSLMPSGLEKDLSHQQMADLIHFVKSDASNP